MKHKRKYILYYKTNITGDLNATTTNTIAIINNVKYPNQII